MANLSVNIAGVALKNPVIAASGTFGFGREYNQIFEISQLGGVACKGLTLKPRLGNPTPRIAETASGVLNSVGLQNPGVDQFIAYDLPWLAKQNTAIIVNIAGNTVEEYCEMAEKLADTAIDIIELNISCPNVKQGGVAFGTSCESVEHITREVKRRAKQPLMVKLSPNVTNIGEIARAAESAGADALSLINTLLGMKIDIRTRKPILRNNTGGLSGPAVLPIAVRMVHETTRAVRIPVIGMGGIASWQDAAEMMLAGASAVQVGTQMFTDPFAPLNIIAGLEKYLNENHISDIAGIVGAVEIWGESH